MIILLAASSAYAQDYGTQPTYGPAVAPAASTNVEVVTPPEQEIAQGDYTYEGHLALGHGKYMMKDYSKCLHHVKNVRSVCCIHLFMAIIQACLSSHAAGKTSAMVAFMP